MIGVGQPPEDAHGNPAGGPAAEGLAALRARRDLPAELDRLRSRVGELEALLEEERAQRRLLQAQLEQTERTIADVRTGAMELALRLTAEQDARRAAPRAAVAAEPVVPVVAPVEPAERAPDPAAEPVAPSAAPVDPETATLIEGLQRAAERLRTQIDERDDEVAELDEPTLEAEPEIAVPAPEPVVPELDPLPVAVLEPRREQLGARTEWLAEALDRLVATDRERAASALTALIPAQAARSRRDLVYDLAVVGFGTWRVRLQSGTGTIGPLLGGPASDRDIDFVVSGPAGSLVPLAAGGARRRLSGTLVTGRRRRLRRLLRDLRAPMGLGDLVAAGTPVDAAVLLELLALMVDPAWTADHAFVVDYDVTGPDDRRWRVAVGEGARTGPAPEVRDAEATVTVPATALPALLAGVPLPAGATATVTGSAESVALLHGWFDAAQGVSA